ncbi:MAG: RNA methyltransferase [Pseudomonadota bacterium]
MANPLSEIRIVLVHTSHPGNIGAVARAMKNMCLAELVLVSPRGFPSAEATARASGADDLLERARVLSSLSDALEGCRFVVGASARIRSVEWPLLDPRACAVRCLQAAATGPVALVFGRENSGLTNSELDLCDALVHIPSNPDYQSLNLAMAVQVLSYELLVASGLGVVESPRREVAPHEQFEGLIEHLSETLDDIGFADPRQSRKLMRRLRRLLSRAQPDEREIRILRGVLRVVQGRKFRQPGSNDPHL